MFLLKRRDGSSKKLEIMKKLIITSIIALLTAVWSIAGAQEWPDEYLGLPGDNLNLYAVMKLFQESETLEGFERSLNDENSRINNLDLNGDNLVDYIMVFDYSEGNTHNIVLRVALNKHENQDVAVFIVERFNNGSVQIQLIGDEALYGKNYIVEPIYAENGNETPNPGYIGNYNNNRRVTVVRTTTYEVAAWPVVRYIYLPSYVVWRSSWYWGYQPVYWNPWSPYYWHYYYGYHSRWYPHYYSYYRHWRHPRSVWYHDHYYSHVRVFSPTVVVNINKNKYKNTYSRPDLRSHGEALYARVESTRTGRTGINGNVSNSQRRSTSQAVNRNNPNVTTGNARRSSTAVSSRTDTRSSEVKSAEVSRRSTNSASRSSAARPAEVKSGTTTRRSSGNINNSTTNRSGDITTGRTPSTVNRSATTVKKAETVRRSSSAVTNRNATAPTVSRKAPATNRSAAIGNKSSATSSSVNRSSVTRKTAPVSSKSATYSSPGRTTRSTGTVTNRSASRPSSRSAGITSGRSSAPSQPRITTKSSSVQKSSAVRSSGSSGQRSSGVRSSGSSAKRSSNERGSENSRPSRR